MELKEFIENFTDALELEEIESVNAETVFRDLEEWDSLAALSTISMFGEKFGKQINNETLKDCNTIQDLYNLSKFSALLM